MGLRAYLRIPRKLMPVRAPWRRSAPSCPGPPPGTTAQPKIIIF